MKLAIMQPYFFPYIGYFQLINAVDEFVVYDNIEYTRKGLINRNRILVGGRDAYISLPLKKDSDFLSVNERFLADSWKTEKNKLVNRIRESYRKAPRFEAAYALVEKCILFEDDNLFNFIYNSLHLISEYLNIRTRFQISSGIEIDHTLKAEKKVIAICRAAGATIYINPIGGRELYSKDEFETNGIDLLFLNTKEINYTQFENEFAPNLSIIDVLMFNSVKEIRAYLDEGYTLI